MSERKTGGAGPMEGMGAGGGQGGGYGQGQGMAGGPANGQYGMAGPGMGGAQGQAQAMAGGPGTGHPGMAGQGMGGGGQGQGQGPGAAQGQGAGMGGGMAHPGQGPGAYGAAPGYPPAYHGQGAYPYGTYGPYPYGMPGAAPHGGAHPGMQQGYGQGAGGMAEMMQALGGGSFSSLGRMLGSDDKEFWKGALVGAAAVLLLTNESVQRALFRTGARAKEAVKSGVDKVRQTAHQESERVKAEAAGNE